MRARYQLRLGILATLAGFLQFFVTAIIVKSLGILLLSMGGELRADTWVLGSVFAPIECVSDVLAPLAGPVGSAVGHRQAVMLGGVLVSMGFVAASQATNVLQVALLLNLPLATGYCLTNVLTRASLGEYFDSRNFALASGITKTGVSISLVCLPPLVQLFNDMYGWRGTMLLVGSIGAHLVVCGALLIPLPEAAMDRNPRAEYEPLTDSQSSKLLSRLANKCGTTMSLKPLVLRAGKDLNLSLLRNGNFWIVACIFVATRITKSAWIIYFVPHVVAKGFSPDIAAAMVTLAGVGHLFGTVFVSVALFKEKVTSTSAMLVSALLLAVLFLVDPWLNATWSLSVSGVVVMSAVGAVYALSDVMVEEHLGYEKMASAYGWMGFFSGIFRVSSGFIPGWIVDHSGSYNLAFIILGAIQVSSLVPLLFRRVKRGFTEA